MRDRRSSFRLLVACLIVTTWAAAATAAEFAVTSTDHGVAVTVDGQLFAEYRTHSGHQPILWPVRDAGGRAMTRSYPVGPQQEHEWDDHPHHRGLWFTHGNVNGHDFWLEVDRQHGSTPAKNNQIAHREFAKSEATDEGATIVAVSDWQVGDKRILTDQRTLQFGADGDLRWIDYAIELHATDGEVVFGDTKEGAFSIRVPGTMKVDEKLGGQLINNHGQKNGDAWGREATWVNYTGPVDGQPAGIAIFCHPDSTRCPTRWHVRTYGLFAANPFALRDFPRDGDGVKQGPLTIPAGESATLRYLVLFHNGDLTAEQLNDWQKRFADGEL